VQSIRRKQRRPDHGARPRRAVPLSPAARDLRDAAAGLAARLRAAAGPAAGPGACADAAAACTAAQLTAQAALQVQAALPAGVTDPGYFPGPREDPAALAGADAPQLAETAQALATRTALLAGEPGQPAAKYLAGAAASLACARRELSRIGSWPQPAAGTR
jgi:hypothetical protein